MTTTTINVTLQNTDIGKYISSAFANGANKVVLVICCPVVWTTYCDLPENCTLIIKAKDFSHEYLKAKDAMDKVNEEDIFRCPITITFSCSRLVYPDRKQGESYANYKQYHMLRMYNHSSFQLVGLTLVDAVPVEPSAPYYEHGFVCMTGTNTACEIRDCRINLAHKCFVLAHAAGIKQINMGHVRFVGIGTTDVCHPVLAGRGQSWLGQKCYVSTTDVQLMTTMKYCDANPEPSFKIKYMGDYEGKK